MEYLFIYMLQIAEAKEPLLFFTILASLSLIVLYYAFYIQALCDEIDLEKNKSIKVILNILKKLMVISLTIFCIGFIIPTKQTLLLSGGLYLGKKAANIIINDAKVQKVNTIIELELDKHIKELKKEVNNGN